MNLQYYVVALFTAFIVTYVSTPISKWFAIKVGAIKKPTERDMHNAPIPRMGGLAIVIGFMVSVIIFIPILKDLNLQMALGILGGGFIIFLVGLADDIKPISAKVKLLFQVVAALVVVAAGVKINVLSIPFISNGTLKIDYVVSLIISVIWIVGVTNAVNLIDGLDGLAAGVSSIAAICLMIIAVLAGNQVAVIITISLVGACLGFLPYNFNPAKIFMGDTGSYFLGFILSVSSILGLFKSLMAAALIVPILVLGLPIFDTTFAIIRRALAGKPIMSPDRGHIHHKLIDRGYSHRKAVLILYAISFAFGILGILVAQKGIYYGLLVFVLLIIIIGIVSNTGSKKDPKDDNNNE